MTALERVLHLDSCTVDLEARVVRRPDGDLTLAPLEVELLRYLAGQRGRAVPRDELLREVWGYRSTRTRTLATTVRRLREKVEADPSAPTHVCTVSGGAYRFQGTRRDPDAGRIPEAGRSFVGRQTERAAIEAAFGRIVTITGPAGVGKSRLAAEIARGSGACWVDLLGSTTRAQVLERLARGFRVAEDLDVAGLARLLATREVHRVVLDDADDAVEALAGLLPALGPTRWLVTSRRPLAVGLERVVRLEGLPADEAAALFVDRAGVERTDAVDRLVARLEGLPLAVELAAGWIPVWSVEDLADRVGTLWLASAQRDGSPRHVSLRAAVEASCGSLSDREREVLRALASFAGDVPRDAIEPVAGAGAMEAVRALATRSLVRVADGEVRVYRPVAEFARAAWPGERWERVHGAWFARLGAVDVLEAIERGDAGLQARLEASRADLALAAERAAATGDAGTAAAAAFAVAAAAMTVGGGVERATEVLERVCPLLTGTERARLEVELASLYRRKGRVADAARVLVSAVVSPDPGVRARALRVRAQNEIGAGQIGAAEATLAEGLEAARAARDPVPEALLLGHLGFLRGIQRRPAEAEEAIERAIALARANGQRRYLAMLLANLAQVTTDAGRDATPLYREAVAIHRSLGARHAEAVLRIGWGDCRIEQGDIDGAHREYTLARRELEALGSRWLAARAAVNDAGAHLRGGTDSEAERLLTEVLPVLEAAGDRSFLAVAHAVRALLALSRGEPALTLLELGAARQFLGDDGDPELTGLVTVATAVAERVSGRLDRAMAPAVVPDGPLAEVLALVQGAAPAADPRWTPFAARADEIGRLARAIAHEPAGSASRSSLADVGS